MWSGRLPFSEQTLQPQYLKTLKKCYSFGKLRKTCFFSFEFTRVDAAPRAPHTHRVLKVQHLVVQQVFDRVARAGGAVEDAAHHNCVVGSVVVAQHSLGVVLTPGEFGPAQQPSEESRIQRIEDLFQMVVAAFRAVVPLAAPGVTNEFRLAGDGRAGSKALVAQIVRRVDRLLVQFGEQNVGDSAENGVRRSLQKIREAYVNLALAKADGSVQRRETAKAHRNGRHRRPRPQRSVLILKHRYDFGGHQEEDSGKARDRGTTRDSPVDCLRASKQSGMKSGGEVRVGISGWRYKGWRGTFYPQKLPQRQELHYAAAHFPSIELNGSFYSLQRPESFERWCEETPPHFVFAVKGSRYLTHMRKLLGIENALANFFAQGMLALGQKLGPILWQFPPQWKFDAMRLEAFFKMLPRTHSEAATLGKHHDQRLKGRTWLHVEHDRVLRHAIEVRHPSFVCEEFIALLRRYNIASVVADTVAWPRLMDVTSDFVYCRLHGDKQLYASGYGSKALAAWANRVVRWAAGEEVSEGTHASASRARRRRTRDVYIYFDNDAKVRAPVDAQSLMKKIAELKQRQAAGAQAKAA